MRSRTEMVTTTFVDSQEEDSDTDDSEEDWKPGSSKKSPSTTKATKPKNRPRKRKWVMRVKSSSSSPSKRRTSEGDIIDAEELLDLNTAVSSDSHSQSSQPQISKTSFPRKYYPQKNIPDQFGIFQLYLYKKDLNADYKTSPICLWRRDGSSLLQKYIRIKTDNCEEFIFTSSSVYSSWDEKRRKDFATIAVQCLEENTRRVKFLNIGDIHDLARKTIDGQNEGTEDEKESDDAGDDDAAEKSVESDYDDEEEDESTANEDN